MNRKHTAGEWIADVRTGCFAIYTGETLNCLSGVENKVIVFQMGRGESLGDTWKPLTDEQIANAYLISAAPNLYELAQAVSGGPVAMFGGNTMPQITEWARRIRNMAGAALVKADGGSDALPAARAACAKQAADEEAGAKLADSDPDGMA